MPLVIVPTPIGNLKDMTLRGMDALRNADLIACEDTRRTLKLLNHYGIRKPLLSYHRHNERVRTEEIMERLERGESVALVSDAGTPAISDPGYVLVESALRHSIPVDALPGANALLPALLLSGICPARFYFAGFVGGRMPGIDGLPTEISRLDAALVFYAAPHDLLRALKFLERALGARRAAVVREISKIHQEAVRGTLPELVGIYGEREIRGEIVIIVEGVSETLPAAEPGHWHKLAAEMKKIGIFDKEIANVLFASYGIPRNEVKIFLLQEAAERERD